MELKYKRIMVIVRIVVPRYTCSLFRKVFGFLMFSGGSNGNIGKKRVKEIKGKAMCALLFDIFNGCSSSIKEINRLIWNEMSNICY